MKLIYVGELLRYKILARQICNHFGLELEHRNDQKDTDLVYSLLYDIKGKLISPTKYHADLWNDKIYQFEKLKDHVPLPKFKVYNSIVHLILDIRKSKEKFFITKKESASGEGNCIFDGDIEVVQQFKKSKPLRASEYIPHKHDISLHLIILNDRNFFVSSIVEQIIDGTRFKGGRFPINLDRNVVGKIHEYCAIIARKLYDTGYVGLCGIDFMVCENGDVYLCELNPRKMGTSPLVSLQMEKDFGIALSSIEYFVNVLNVLPDIKIEEKTGWELNLIDYDKKYSFFPENYFKNGVYVYNDTYQKNSFKITKWDMSVM